jgi:hypothetical protein
MKKRDPKPDDDEKVRKACHLSAEIVEINRDIDQTLWASAFAFTLAVMFSSSAPYEKFCDFLDELKIVYKDMWDKEGAYGKESD